MDRKISMALFLSFLFLVFSLSNSGTNLGEAQQGPPPQRPQIMFGQGFDTQKEIEVLRAINETGLNEAQLEEFQTIIEDLIAARAMKEESQEELRVFLLEFKGNDFAKKLTSYQESWETAETDFEAQLEETLTRIEEMLTPEQGEALLHYIFQHYLEEFLTSNLELLNYSVGCKLNPESCKRQTMER